MLRKEEEKAWRLCSVEESMEWDTLSIEKRDDVAFLTLDRSASLNAVNDQLTTDLEAACQTLDADADLHVVVLQGEGRAFCSGMDLKAAAMRPSTNAAIDATWAPWQRALDTLEHLNALTIASIQGACLGAGCELVLACDFRIAAETAFFSLPQVLYGAPPDASQSYKLAQLVGLAKAKEILILGERFDASQAERWGLLTKVVEAANLKEETGRLVERCQKVGGRAAAVAKHLLHQSWTIDQDAWPAEISRARAAALEEKDFAEAMRIYREQRRPQV